jgi:hypothetical protein
MRKGDRFNAKWDKFNAKSGTDLMPIIPKGTIL